MRATGSQLCKCGQTNEKSAATAELEKLNKATHKSNVPGEVCFQCSRKVGSLTPSTASTRSRRPIVASFGFLDLPPDIRCLIYEELLSVGKVFFLDTDSEQCNSVRYKDKRYYGKPYLSILRVCKQTHQEAEPIYLSKNLFVLPLHWHLHDPFCGYDSDVEPPDFFRKRLFSDNANLYLRKISFSIDNKDLAIAHGENEAHRSWSKATAPYESFTHSDRVAQVHMEMVERLTNVQHSYDRTWRSLMEVLREFEGISTGPKRSDWIDSRIQYVEIDYTNAFCPMGCCRPVHGVYYDWIEDRKSTCIDIVGTRCEEEETDIIESIQRNQGLELASLKDDYGWQFRKSDDSPRWNRWKYDEPQRDGVLDRGYY
ncbi:hypothetical protein CC80DRAFT_92288 [Byssothecium circinans]|uniref:F-box domain-containing protein n=1 Tax=Byssothecium circinans TaxID=147558 RepID=A0A6A5TRS9_9PLEO|nr:hypothetical protein CC80DRAFT_92288 [Byssothecium circinans]